MTEGIARVQFINDIPLIENFNATGANNKEMIEGLRSCRNDNCSTYKIFDFDLGRDLLEIRGAQCAKGRLLR